MLFKISRKIAFFALMLAASAYAAKYGWRMTMQATGQKVSAEESDLMATVFDSGIKLVTGQAKKDELASRLSDQLYAGRASAQDMKDLGIAIVKPGESSAGTAAASSAGPAISATGASNLPGRSGVPGIPGAANAPSARVPLPTSADLLKEKLQIPLLLEIWKRLGGDRLGLALIPVTIGAMVLKRRFKRKDSKLDEILAKTLVIQNANDADVAEMKYNVQALGSEEFELLIALIHQRQGYRVAMPEGMSGGKGGDFTIARKAEKALVQCKKLSCDHRLAVERIKEFHEAMVTANFTKGFYVASCGFSWDARHFAKTKGITLINAKILDQQIDAAKETPEEDLLAVDTWAADFMQKVTLTPSLCPTCDAAMDDVVVAGRPVWLCSQRPDCRGARNARKRRKPARRPVAAAKPVKKSPDAARARAATVRKPVATGEADAVPRRAARMLTSSKVMAITEEEAAQISPEGDLEPETVATVSANIGNAADEVPSEKVYVRPTGVRSVVPREQAAQKPAPLTTGVDEFLSRLTVRFSATRMLAQRGQKAAAKAAQTKARA